MFSINLVCYMCLNWRWICSKLFKIDFFFHIILHFFRITNKVKLNCHDLFACEASFPETYFLVLVKSTNQWVPARGGSVPANALKAGMTKSGKTLYMGRLNHLNSLTPGKVHPSHGACYIPLGGEELKFTDYEVFLANWN